MEKPVTPNSRCPVCRTAVHVEYELYEDIPRLVGAGPICPPCEGIIARVQQALVREAGEEGVYDGETLHRAWSEGVV